ncbi:MAG: 50S ribosomal protein L29 [Terriglobia bacterium]
MKAEKMRDWSAAELAQKQHEFSDQLFRLKFQLMNGQTQVLSKIRVLRKDIARAKTLQRELQTKDGVDGQRKP